MSPTVAPLPEPANAGELSTVAARRGRSLVWLKLGRAIGTPEVLVTLTLSILAPAFLWTYADTLGLPDWSYVVALAAGACASRH